MLVDLYDCEPSTVNDLRLCYDFLEDAVDVLGVHKQAPPFVFQSPSEFPDKAGLSGWIPLVESGIQIHTLTQTNFISVDFYTCSVLTEEMAQRLLDFASKTFSPGKLDSQLVQRGTAYYI